MKKSRYVEEIRIAAFYRRMAAKYEPQATAVELAQLGGEGLLRGTSCNVINLTSSQAS